MIGQIGDHKIGLVQLSDDRVVDEVAAMAAGRLDAEVSSVTGGLDKAVQNLVEEVLRSWILTLFRETAL